MSHAASAADPRLPAEFEPHSATWLCWPHNRDSWPDDLPAAVAEFEALVDLLASSEPVHVLVEAERSARARVEFHVVPSDDAWLRDTGPSFVREGPALVALDWGFNGWGAKYPHAHDAGIAARVAVLAGAERRRPGLVAEGGALEVDGEGTLLTTRSSLLDPARNPGRDEAAVEDTLRRALGVCEVIWVEGELAGDDTDGHVDNLARFVAPGRVVSGVPAAGKSLRGAHDARGREIEVIDLPPPPKLERGGDPLPASYANFYIANQVVAVPQFGVPEDAAALEVLRPLFPDRRVVGLGCRTLLAGLGGLHCLTQQQPGAA